MSLGRLLCTELTGDAPWAHFSRHHNFLLAGLWQLLPLLAVHWFCSLIVTGMRAQIPIPGRVQRQVGWGSVQPALVEAVPAPGRGLGFNDL